MPCTRMAITLRYIATGEGHEPRIMHMKLFTESPYQNVIDFIDVAVDSDELKNWLNNVETLPDNLRSDHLARMKAKMLSNKESDKVIDIVESINNREILSAANSVIKDVYNSGMKAKKYLKKNNNENFNVLVSLMASI